MFPHFGFGGWKEHYTGYFPAWYLSYALSLWTKGIERERGEDFCQRFKATLSPKDMAILELRVEGYGYQEIADKLGYKTHSAAVKRMEAIKRRFIQYEEEAGR